MYPPCSLSAALQLEIMRNIMPAVQLAAIYIVMLLFKFPSQDHLYGLKFILINVSCKWEAATDKGNPQLRCINIIEVLLEEILDD